MLISHILTIFEAMLNGKSIAVVLPAYNAAETLEKDRQTDRQTDRRTDRQTDRYTNKKTDTHAHNVIYMGT